MNTTKVFASFAATALCLSGLTSCSKHDNTPSQPEATSSEVVASMKASEVQPLTSGATTAVAQSDRVELTPETDPAELGGLFFGQIIAVGKGVDIAVDQKLALLLTGALTDAAGEGVSSSGPQGAFKTAYISSIRNGIATWEGRSLPASIVTVEIQTVNRAAGKYGRICFAFAALKDVEFNYLRSPLYSFCDEKQHAQRVAQWESETHFQQTSQFGKELPYEK